MLVMKRREGRLGHKVFQKPTHIDPCLYWDSSHHTGQKWAGLKTLIDLALWICELHFLRDELKHLDTVIQTNTYSVTKIRRAIWQRTAHQSVSAEDQTEARKAFLLYTNSMTDQIERLLRRHGVKTVFRPTQSIQQHLKSAENTRDLLILVGIYLSLIHI